MSLAETLKQQAADDWFDRLGNMEFIDDQKQACELNIEFCWNILTPEFREQGMSILTAML